MTCIFHNATNHPEDAKSIFNTYEKDKELRAYISLWRGVILQLLLDANTNSKKKSSQRIKMEALRWWYDGSNQVHIKKICELAHFDYDHLMKKAKKALKNNCRWRRSDKS